MSTQERKRPPLLLLCLAQFMLTLDFAIVNVALPWIKTDLSFTSGALPWVVGAYALFYGGFLLLGGRVGDIIGRKRMFVWGLAIFTAASVLGGVATTPIVLIISRALQGLSAAAVAPAVLAMIGAGYPEGPERAKAMGVFGAVSSVGFAGGVLAGGVLTEVFGWRAVMLVNIPVGIYMVVRAAIRLDDDRSRTRKVKIDIPGAILVTASMCSLAYALTLASDLGWGDSSVLTPLIGGGVLLLVFLFVQTKVSAPLVPLSVFRNRGVTGGNLVAFLSGGVMSISTFFVTLYLQHVLGFSAIITGLAFFPQALVVVLASLPVAKATAKHGARPLLTFGALFLIAGSAYLALAPTDGGFLVNVLPGGVLLGLGITVMMISTAVAATSGVPVQHMGLASGLYNSNRQLGVGLCLSVAVTVATLTSGAGAGISVEGIQAAFWLSAALAVLVAVISAIVVPAKKNLPVPPQAPAPRQERDTKLSPVAGN
ncbi:MFS transporter [Saccharothrix violaceirubra]|uniref:EmrB/QacA subfamily drug resistance transporter n=1 Tax=Saccharothrix violaceirubra TaxID=413306 RepID=A0A7W7WXG5_9PSEU|nr:MFS transporter [Saccharothrix violaceirubra]MBB4967370.1 EmrB/QacA subfamily drug resistance transporter [Saccharothrix violaceirubra]